MTQDGNPFCRVTATVPPTPQPTYTSPPGCDPNSGCQRSHRHVLVPPPRPCGHGGKRSPYSPATSQAAPNSISSNTLRHGAALRPPGPEPTQRGEDNHTRPLQPCVTPMWSLFRLLSLGYTGAARMYAGPRICFAPSAVPELTHVGLTLHNVDNVSG